MTVIKLPFQERPDETPAERTLRWMEYNPELLEETTTQLYVSMSEFDPGDAAREYKQLSERKKKEWRERTLKKMKDFAEMSPAEQKMTDRVSMGKLLKKNDARFKRMSEE